MTGTHKPSSFDETVPWIKRNWILVFVLTTEELNIDLEYILKTTGSQKIIKTDSKSNEMSGYKAYDVSTRLF